MKAPSLRTRLLTATAAIFLLTIGVSFVIVSQMRTQLIDQIDDRLNVVASNAVGGPGDSGPGDSGPGDSGPGDSGPGDSGPGDSGPGDGDSGDGGDRDNDGPDDDADRPPPNAPGTGDGGGGGVLTRPPDIYDGTLTATGELETEYFAARDGVDLDPPVIDLETAGGSDGMPITVAGGDVRYRVIAGAVDGGEYVITGLPLDGVDATISLLIRVVAISVVAIFVGLVAATWWVIRLGITPLRKMTRTAETIAAGDLSGRIPDVDETTEAGQLGSALNTMLGQIETSFDERVQAEERLRQFLADASHELRTPVATIRGYAELYRAGALGEQSALDDAMRRTEQESLRMSRLINDILDLAKLDRSPTLATGKVDVAEIVRDAAKDAAARAPDRRIVDTSADQPILVDCDGDLMRQIVTNLVGNALVHTSAPAIISLSAWIEDDRAHISVVDDGIGMSQESVRRATERFYRADPARTRSKGGSGLGLSIVETAIAAHGGAMLIASEIGEGTSVSVQLPVTRPSSDSY